MSFHNVRQPFTLNKEKTFNLRLSHVICELRRTLSVPREVTMLDAV